MTGRGGACLRADGRLSPRRQCHAVLAAASRASPRLTEGSGYRAIALPPRRAHNPCSLQVCIDHMARKQPRPPHPPPRPAPPKKPMWLEWATGLQSCTEGCPAEGFPRGAEGLAHGLAMLLATLCRHAAFPPHPLPVRPAPPVRVCARLSPAGSARLDRPASRSAGPRWSCYTPCKRRVYMRGAALRAPGHGEPGG